MPHNDARMSALRQYDGPCRTGEISVDENFAVKIVNIYPDLTRSSCAVKDATIGSLAGIEPAALQFQYSALTN